MVPFTLRPAHGLLALLAGASLLAGGRVHAQAASYTVTVVTSNRSGAGTDSNIDLRLFGASGESPVIPLRRLVKPAAEGNFKPGDVDVAHVKLDKSIGRVSKISLRSDGKFRNSEWHVKSVTVKDNASGVESHFHYDVWFDDLNPKVREAVGPAVAAPPMNVAGGQPLPPGAGPIAPPKLNKADLTVEARLLDGANLVATFSNRGSAPSAENRYVVQFAGRDLAAGPVPSLRPGESANISVPKIGLMGAIIVRLVTPDGGLPDQAEAKVLHVAKKNDPKIGLVVGAQITNDLLAATITNRGSMASAENRYVIESNGRGLGSGSIPVLQPGASINIGPLKLAPSATPVPIVVRIAVPDGDGGFQTTVIRPASPPLAK